MGAGRNFTYNPRTGKYTRPKAWYDKGRKKKNGCYIATAVYGSYDCPEVWTLRRFRDKYLSDRIWGQVFIRIYYGFSPTIVKIFGNMSWFNRLWKHRLDNFVSVLNAKGYDSTPYIDKD